MNTNNAPERIELPNGCYFAKLGDNTCWCGAFRADGTRIPRFPDMIWPYAKEIAAAMQPQVSESDEAVAREIASLAVKWNAQSGSRYLDEEVCAAILARHRQPAAVSAYGVEIQRLKGVLQNASATIDEWITHPSDRSWYVVLKEEIDAALSPETVCGGE